MTTYQTVEELRDAYASGALSREFPVTLDNDSTSVSRNHDDDWLDVEDVFDMHPQELLEQALTLLGIPWTPA